MNNGRTQSLNHAFLFNTAWDYASDTRGYTIGVSIAVVHPTVAVDRRELSGADDEERHPTSTTISIMRRGDKSSLISRPNKIGTVIRLLAFHNEGNMGDYREAMTIGRAAGTVPDAAADEQPGRTKYGFGINIEQPLANDGETGLFARAGWANGTNSAWSYTEVDRSASMGLQVSGRNWGRPGRPFRHRRCGRRAFRLSQALSRGRGHRHAHRRRGPQLRPRRVFETYYRIQLGRFVQLSPDFQYIQNPGYNRDRGPVKVYGMRLRVSY